jgi:DNA-binding transcriptional ArsR family regulator
MVERLIHSPATVKQLAQPLAMSLPAVMQHLGVLEACGLVSSEKVGRTRTCHIEPGGLRVAEDWLREQRTAWEIRLDHLGEVLDENVQPASKRSTT